MRSTSILCPRVLRNPCVAPQARRWATYDNGSLRKEVLLSKVEAELGEDHEGKPLKVDMKSKKISTAAGELPISPIFDPSWMKARRQESKPEARRPHGRFRKKLANNPFALALETPIRKCPNSGVYLPRYFLQDFELIKHPDSGDAWWAPGPLAFEYVEPNERKKGDNSSESKAKDKTSDEESKPPGTQSEVTASTVEWRPRRAPLTSYVLCRRSAVDLIAGNRKHLALLLAMRTGMAMAAHTGNPVWREDMSDLLLKMMRQRAVDALIVRGSDVWELEDQFIQPCKSWDDVKEVWFRGCVLWLPGSHNAASEPHAYATFDIEGAKYGRKMAVHNLLWLLGKDEFDRLRSSTEVFRQNEILILKQWGTRSMMRLHLLLWRLQGYLAEPLVP